MIVKEYTAKDTCGRNRLFVDAKCESCGTLFSRQKRLFRTEYITCSIKCNNIAKGNSVYIKCKHCNEEFLRAKSKISVGKSGFNFCSRHCKEEAQKYLLEIMPDHYYTGSGEYSYRRIAFEKLAHKCNRCEYSSPRGSSYR